MRKETKTERELLERAAEVEQSKREFARLSEQIDYTQYQKPKHTPADFFKLASPIAAALLVVALSWHTVEQFGILSVPPSIGASTTDSAGGVGETPAVSGTQDANIAGSITQTGGDYMGTQEQLPGDTMNDILVNSVGEIITPGITGMHLEFEHQGKTYAVSVYGSTADEYNVALQQNVLLPTSELEPIATLTQYTNCPSTVERNVYSVSAFFDGELTDPTGGEHLGKPTDVSLTDCLVVELFAGEYYLAIPIEEA